MQKSKLINVARGIEIADFVIKNATIINVLSEEMYKADIAITNSTIAGVGDNYRGQKELDATGMYISPAFIDGHVHLESSMLMPKEFAKSVIPAGTTTVISDPHEIANVYGINGINFMHEAVNGIPLEVYTMLPSCVPATPFETSGYALNNADLSELIDKTWVLGLAEMMNAPGVINSDNEVLKKLELAQQANKVIDGHSPMLKSKDLCAYIASGVKSDHECTTPEEAKEKLRLGMYLMVREGTAAKDLNALLPILKECNTRKCIFVTDDRHPSDLKEHINGMVRRVVEAGVSPIKAIECASLNTAEYFGLKNIGAIAPGYQADLLILPDLKTFKPKIVIKKGKIVAEDSRIVDTEFCANPTPAHQTSINVKPLKIEDFSINTQEKNVKTIQILPHQLVTKAIKSEIKLVDGNAVSNTETDTLKICVIDRHHKTGNIGKGFVKGFNLKSGAIASTVAHDSHNIIVVGTCDEDMLKAVEEIINIQGGKVVVSNGKVVAKLPLPIAGLISDKDFDYVLEQCNNLNKAVQSLGCTLEDAFMTMGFLALPVIPELKLTDKGLFDVNKFEFTNLF